jgi:site-specific recombinase XerD
LKYIKRVGRYLYYAKPGSKLIRLPDLPENDPRFIRAYAAAADSAEPIASVRTARPGTIAAACAAYRSSPDFRALSPSTRARRGRILDSIAEKGAAAQIAGLREEHVRRDLSTLAPHAAKTRLKAWRGLLRFARSINLIDANPSRDITVKLPRSDGHRQWTREEIARFRAAHPIGSEARLKLELLYWCGSRRQDAILHGRQQIGRDGWLRYRQKKTGAEVEIPFLQLLKWMEKDLGTDHRELTAALAALPAGRMIFLSRLDGLPRSEKAFGASFKKDVLAAGLPDDLSAHGLRKARMSALAELGWTHFQIMSWTGHETLAEVQRYTKAANRRRVLSRPDREQDSGKSVEPFSENVENPNEIRRENG